MSDPLILEIKGNSLDDGPGIRSVVFFKGCPLSCLWCHNPESKNLQKELSYDSKLCISCGDCFKVCDQAAIENTSPMTLDRGLCNLCMKCVDICPSQALTTVGFSMSIDQLTDKLLKDKPFYDVSGGGVTISGGEATLYPKFVGRLLARLKENNIHTLLETCGHFKLSLVKKYILPFIDLIFYDLKIFDPNEHKEYCGTDNRLILENFQALQKLSNQMGFKIIPRTPLIPGITDREENLKGIANFLKDLNVEEAHLLPYNPLWYEKEEQLGLESQTDQLKEKSWQSAEKLSKCREIFKNCKIFTK